MTDSGNISGSARWLRRVTLAALAAVIAVTVLSVPIVLDAGARLGPVVFDTGLKGFGAAGRIAGAGVTIIVGLLFACALWRLNRMLERVAAGEGFSGDSVRHLRAFALYAFLSTIASTLLPVIAQLLIILSRSPRAGALILDFSGSDLLALLISGLLFLVARLLGEAQRIAEENRMIV